MQQCRIAALAASQHSGRLPTEFSNANFRSIVSKQSKISIPAGADHGRVLRSDGSRDNQQGAASAPVTFCCEVLNIITAHSLLTKRMPAPVGLLIANGKEFVSAPRPGGWTIGPRASSARALRLSLAPCSMMPFHRDSRQAALLSRSLTRASCAAMHCGRAFDSCR